MGDEAPHVLVGILTRGDILAAHGQRLQEAHDAGRYLHFSKGLVRRRPFGA